MGNSRHPIALYIAMRANGITAAELTRRLHVDEVQRILNPHHATPTTRISEAIAATGGHAVIELRLG